MTLLSPNQVVQSQTGQPCKVDKFLGGGGQGEVYKAQWGGHDVALKWYNEQCATSDQKAALEALIRAGTPTDKFLWPEDLASAIGVPGFGYIMKLRPPEYKGLDSLMAGRIEPPARVLITAGFELTKAFRDLHTKGLCYRDISFGNAFFDPTTGAVLICDNDNVAQNRTAKSGVAGTPDFMAPEIVRMEAKPSTSTDMHSLAVLLFYLLSFGHPLLGKRILKTRCWDGPAREKMFGKEPLFIFDPNDDSNAAVDLSVDPTGEAGALPKLYWAMYPSFLKKTFIKAFTTGLHNPNERVTELEWQRALVALRDSLFYCACGKANYYDLDVVQAGGRSKKCWDCRNDPQLPFRIRIGKSIVMLNAETKLFSHHINDDFVFSTPVAEVIRHPTDRNIWGLKNLGTVKWSTGAPDGTMKDVEPGKSVPLVANTKIHFGMVDGEICY